VTGRLSDPAGQAAVGGEEGPRRPRPRGEPGREADGDKLAEHCLKSREIRAVRRWSLERAPVRPSGSCGSFAKAAESYLLGSVLGFDAPGRVRKEAKPVYSAGPFVLLETQM